nr:MAG TPA: hypothetical protein [Caudoviricetes sp.]
MNRLIIFSEEVNPLLGFLLQYSNERRIYYEKYKRLH